MEGRMKRGATRLRIAHVLAAALWLIASASGAKAKPKKKQHPTHKPAVGKFDYYVRSLSWSPQHCAEPAGKSDTMQCHSKRHFAFVLHGLWPQFEKGYPQS